MLLARKKLPALFLSVASLLCFSTALPSLAQDWHGPDAGGPPGGPMEHSFRGGEHGRWWDNPRVAQQIGLTDDQKKKMDDILQQHRLRLIDLHAALDKDQVMLRPMLQADQLDEAKILAQIDTIAQARAELEKANARMLFGIRKVLTPDQWKKVQALVAEHRDRIRDQDRRGWEPGGERWNSPGAAPNGPPPARPDGPPSSGSAPAGAPSGPGAPSRPGAEGQAPPQN